MNYLAHFYLSFGQEPLVIGNLLGDFVRGRIEHPRNAHYTQDVKIGIQLHRHIDFFTDNNPAAIACKRELPPQFARIGGVITDMYFDHFLAKYFHEFHQVPLADFTAQVYEILLRHRSHLPADTHPLIDSMVKYDWLQHYARREGMARSFGGMSRRYPFLKGIEQADEELFRNEAVYERYFRQFFPQLVESCEEYLGE